MQYDGKKEAKRIERWSKIAKEAAEQAHRHRIPSIQPVQSWRQMLTLIGEFDLALFCYEREGAAAHGKGIANAVRQWKLEREKSSDEVVQNPRIVLLVGPEGGFSEREAVEAEAAGAILVGLGKRILRTETAGLVGLTCLLYESGAMEGA